MAKAELIFVSNPAAGHLTSIMKFAKALVHHDHQLFITILVTKLPFTRYVDVYLKFLTDSQPNIRIIHISQPDPNLLPSSELLNSIENYMLAFFDAHKPLVRDKVRDIIMSRNASSPIVGLVFDQFCPSMLDIGDEFGMPSFIYSVSSMSFLNLMLYMSSQDGSNSLKELSLSDSKMLSIPGFSNLVPPRVLPRGMFRDGGYEAFMQIAKGFRDCKGVIYNSFYEFESFGMESCKKSNVYPVGPLINRKAHPNPELDKKEWDKIMKWLDEQAESSVVYLCFGSAGTFSVEQVKEIALGLEQSGHKFLWSMRVNNLKEMVPEGFAERVKGRGVISTGWSPQAEVLEHKAIGGFVSHCGWNSVLESIWFGVPIATLPLYAEHQIIAFSLVTELELAVDLKLDYSENGELIGKDEVEKSIRSLMDSENEVKKKVKDMSRIARSVGMEGGSSFNSLSQFIRDVRK